MTKKNKNPDLHQQSMVFQSFNYKLLVLGLLLVTGGFTAMYLENEVSGVISLFISPIVIMAGYTTVIFSIMTRSSQSSSTKNSGAH